MSAESWSLNFNSPPPPGGILMSGSQHILKRSGPNTLNNGNFLGEKFNSSREGRERSDGKMKEPGELRRAISVCGRTRIWGLLGEPRLRHPCKMCAAWLVLWRGLPLPEEGGELCFAAVGARPPGAVDKRLGLSLDAPAESPPTFRMGAVFWNSEK